jgi:hypothetical protein
MENLNNYILLKDSVKKDVNILNSVFLKVKELHAIKYKISKRKAKRDIKIELYYKTLKRLKKVSGIIVNYNKTKIKRILKKSYKYIIKNINVNDYCLIHGDLNGSNIMISKNKDIKFIDPRGYFGKTKLFGLKEYDYAKIKYFLEGYEDLNSNNKIFYSCKKYDRPLKIDFRIRELENDIINIMVGIIFISLTEWIANDILKVNIAYNYGLELIERSFKK